jgi:hypothetical protein
MATSADGLFSTSTTLGRPQVRSVQHQIFRTENQFSTCKKPKNKNKYLVEIENGGLPLFKYFVTTQDQTFYLIYCEVFSGGFFSFLKYRLIHEKNNLSASSYSFFINSRTRICKPFKESIPSLAESITGLHKLYKYGLCFVSPPPLYPTSCT